MDDAVNPFDDETLSFLVLRGPEGALSLWPGFKPVPPGWHTAHGPADRADCLAFVARSWPGPAVARAQV